MATSESQIEPIVGPRYIIDGLVFTMSVMEVIENIDPALVGNREIAMTCKRCKARWSKGVTRAELAAAYDRIPSRSAALTLVNRVPGLRQVVLAWASGHICMPRGYAHIRCDVALPLIGVDPVRNKACQRALRHPLAAHAIVTATAFARAVGLLFQPPHARGTSPEKTNRNRSTRENGRCQARV